MNDELEQQIKRLAVRGLGWIAFSRLLTQILITAGNLVLVRLLFPAEFGTFAIIQFLVSLVWVFADLGLRQALVQRQEEPETPLLRSVWWTHLGLGVLMAAVLWLVGPLFISYYAGQLEPQAVSWLRWFVVSQILVNMSLVSVGLLERRLAYKKILIGGVSELFVTQVSTIVLAFFGFGVASFVVGAILGKFVALVAFFRLSPWAWGVGWDWNRLKSMLSFGVPLQMSAWLGIINGAVVPLFVGRFPGPGGWSGPEAVGFITWAGGVAALPTVLAHIVDQMIFPLMSRLQKTPELAGRFFERMLRIVVVVMFAVAAVLFVLAPEVTRLVYTPDWLPALPALRLAIIQTIFIATTSLALNTLLAFGEASFLRNMHALWALLQWVLAVPLVLTLGFWGVNVAGILVSATALYAFVRLNRYFRLPLFRIVTVPALVATLTALIVFGVVRLFPVGNIIHLLLVGMFGGAVYSLLISIFMRRELAREFVFVKGLVRGLVTGR